MRGVTRRRHLKACREEKRLILNDKHSQKTRAANTCSQQQPQWRSTDRIYMVFTHHSSASYVGGARHTLMYSAPADKLYETRVAGTCACMIVAGACSSGRRTCVRGFERVTERVRWRTRAWVAVLSWMTGGLIGHVTVSRVQVQLRFFDAPQRE